MHSVRPSLLKIIWTDYPSFIFSSMAVVAWIVCLAWIPDWRGDGAVASPVAAKLFLGVAILLTLLGLGVLLWRAQILWTIFLGGAEVRGKISKIEMRRDRGLVEYTYIYNHEEYQSSASIHRTKQTLALKTGERVTLMVDSKSPKRAFIRDLYA